MIKTLAALFVGISLGAAAVWLLVPHAGKAEPEKKNEEAKTESRLIHTNDETWIRLDKKSQEAAGIKTIELQPVTINPEIKAYGRVLDPTPLANLSIEIATARAALEASQKEFERLKTLHAQGQNVSTHALETAEAAWKRDQVTLQSAQLRLLTGWGKQIADMQDLPTFVQSLAALQTALVRLDVPLGESIEKPPSAARVAPLEDESRAAPAKFLGPVAAVDAQSQGRGFLFLMETNALPPSAAVTGWLIIPGDAEKGMVVPGSAVVRNEGENFVYLNKAHDLFSREGVELKRPAESGWLVEGELKAGDKLVTTGAQQLLSEELKAQNAEE